MADGNARLKQRRDHTSAKHKVQDSEEDDDDEKKDDLESSSSPNSSSGASGSKDRRSEANPRRTPAGGRNKSDDSSSALSLPHSFDDFTPGSTPAVSPAPNRLRTFDAELKRPPPVQTSAMPSQFNATNGPRVQGAMRKFYELQVDKMRKQLAAVLEDKTQTQRLLATERQTHENTVTTLQTSYRRDAAQWKSDKAASEARIALLERRLVAEKASFVELRVSDALAQEFQKQDQDALTLAEFIQMRVYELIQPHVAAADRAAKELHDVASQHAECAATVAALERTARIAKQQQDKSDLALHDMEVERDAVAQQLEAAQAALLEQRRVAVQSDDDDGINWKEKYTALDLDLMRARQRAADLQVDNEQLAQKVQLLSVDKAYLVQDKELTAEKVLQLTRALDDATATCRRLELSKATFLEQIESTREETRSLFEKRMEVELAKLQDASRKEMDLLRDNGKQLYERENRLLREARLDAQSQLDHLHTKVSELQHAYEDKVLESTRADAKWTTDVAALRNDLKMKHFELAQLGRQFDDTSRQLHQSHLENDMYKQKVDAHKAEFAKLEASTGKQIAQLQLAVAAEREKLHAYDKLEVEMDNAILQSGALTDEASATFAMIPTAPKRRFQQSVALAQKLVQTEQQLATTRQQLEHMETEKAQVASELAAARLAVHHMHQPQQFLIEKLKAKDDEVQTLQRQVTRLDESVARHQQETNTQLQAKLALQNQLQLLLSRRHELDTLKAFVLKAVQTTPSTETGSSSHQQHPHLQPPPTPLDTKVPKWYLKLRQQQPTT